MRNFWNRTQYYYTSYSMHRTHFLKHPNNILHVNGPTLTMIPLNNDFYVLLCVPGYSLPHICEFYVYHMYVYYTCLLLYSCIVFFLWFLAIDIFPPALY